MGRWLAADENADRVTAELATLVRGAVAVLRDEDVQAVLEPVLRRRLAEVPVGPTLGRLLGEIVADGAHHGLVDLVAAAADDWLRANRDLVVDVVARQAPAWSPEFIDRRVAARVLRRAAPASPARCAHDPAHPVRVTLDRLLARLADDLRHDPATIAKASSVLAALLDEPEVRRAFGDLIAAGRRLLLELIDDPASELRSRLTGGLAGARPPAGRRPRAAVQSGRLGRGRGGVRGRRTTGTS